MTALRIGTIVSAGGRVIMVAPKSKSSSIIFVLIRAIWLSTWRQPSTWPRHVGSNHLLPSRHRLRVKRWREIRLQPIFHLHQILRRRLTKAMTAYVGYW
jgi:hypothetical protein